MVPNAAAKSDFFGWKVAWAAFVIAAFGAGVGLYGPSVFLSVLHGTRAWSIATISAAITTHFLLSALIVVYLPQIHRRFALATVTMAGTASCCLGIIVWATAQHPWQLFPAALLTGAGWAATSSASINAMIARWFDRERPRALSLALNGASLGGVLFPPLWVALISWLGFPGSALVVAAATLAVIWPIAQHYLRPLPAKFGLTLDGHACAAPARTLEPTISRADLLRCRRFTTFAAAFAVGLFAQIGLVAHLVARLAPEVGPGPASAALSLITVSAIVGRTFLGWTLRDRNRRLVAVANFLVQAVGISLLTVGGGAALLALGCIIFGLTGGNHLTLPPLIAQDEFKPADVTTVVALAVAISQGAMAFGPSVFGMLHDTTASYVVPFALAAVAQVVAGIILLAGCGRSRRFGSKS